MHFSFLHCNVNVVLYDYSISNNKSNIDTVLYINDNILRGFNVSCIGVE